MISMRSEIEDVSNTTEGRGEGVRGRAVEDLRPKEPHS